MSSPLVTGGCFALKSKLNDKYLRYSPEKGKILEVSGEDFLNPYTRFCAELSKEHDGLVHIRCCYNNKYWVAREVNSDWCLKGDANEPQEDLADPSCTLLRHEPCVDSVKLQHASLKSSVYMLTDAHPTTKTLRAGSLLLGNQPDEDAYMFSVIDLEGQMVLPQHVGFKGENGMYLKAFRDGDNLLQFGSDSIADSLVENIIETNSDGTIRLKSYHFGMYWKRSPKWILADSDGMTNRDPDTRFQVIFLEHGRPTEEGALKCALRNLGNNHFCKRLTAHNKTSCLSASASTIDQWAQLELHETVLSRRIYGIEYHNLDDATIHNVKPRTFFSKTISNRTSTPMKSTLTISYSTTTETRWDSSVSLKLGVTTKITAKVPLIAEASVEISTEFTGSYSWGETKVFTEEHSSEDQVDVPANTETTIYVVGKEGTCDIPFSYMQEDLLTTGERIVKKMDDGIYRGVNTFDLRTGASEKKL